MIVLSILSWTIVFFLGLTFIQLLSDEFKPVEKLGFAMPVGIGLSSGYMFLLNLVGIPVNIVPLLLGGELLIGLLFLYLYYRKHKRFTMSPRDLLRDMENPGFDVTYYLILGVIAILILVVSAKAMLWPVLNYDAVTGYDLLGKFIAGEGTLHNSVFDKINSLENNRTGYPPLYPYTLAFAHITGAANPKFTNIFFYLPMAVCFYALLRHYVTPLGAGLFTLLLISAPDYADFSSLSSNNTPLALYAGLGLICIYLWYDKGHTAYFRLGTALTAFGMWDRLEGVFFFAVAAILIAMRCWPLRKFRKLIVFGGVSLLTVIVWELYLKYVLDAIVNIKVRFFLFWDPEKIKIMASQINKTTFDSDYWGIVINACLILIAINIGISLIKRRKDKWILLAAVAVAWALYVILFYQMDSDFEHIGWLKYSYKRGLYTYLPPLIFGVAILFISQYAFGHKSVFRNPNKSRTEIS